MADKTNLSMREQRLRRQRINRIKTTIIMTIGVWIFLSMVCCVGLTIQVFRLNHKIDELSQNTVAIQQVTDEKEDYRGTANAGDAQTMSVGETVTRQEITTISEETNVTEEKEEYTSSGMEEDNLVQEGVTQKVYLTFDDGPSANTAKILDILKEKNVKATFFVIGTEDEENRELYQRIVAEGHTLGMHSYSHKYNVIYDSLESFQNDFNQLRTYLTETTGVEPTIMRFPGGSSNKVSNIEMEEFIRYVNQQGVQYYDWNVASGDATSQAYTPDELIENVIQDVAKYDTSIVLMHDASTKGTTVEALGPMIDQLKAMGVDLLPIDENTRMIQHISADDINE